MQYPEATRPTPVLVPIRSLGPAHRERIAAHLLALDERDRYLRFGYAASDDQIQRYAQALDFDRDEIFGIYNRKLELIAMAHLALPGDACGTGRVAEFGVSVLAKARGRGYGSRLFERAVMHARNEGVQQLMIHALSENTAMLRIATRAGAVLARSGSETEAHLKLPPATLDTQVTEIALEQFAAADYRLKQGAKDLNEFLASVQGIRAELQDEWDRLGR